jgi:peptide/nickel transport system substrate-binding protein
VTVKPGGTVVWATDADPADLDPYAGAGFPSRQGWGDLVYQSLVMLDDNLKVTPGLAESWTATGPLRWTFKLRQGVTFHDGSQLEAEDVAAWFEHQRSYQARPPDVSWRDAIARVEPKGRYEVDLVLAAPFAPLLASLASLRGSAIVSHRPLATTRGAAGPLAGSGPFKIAEVVPNSLVRLVKHPDYWEPTLPQLAEIMIRTEPDEARRIALVRAGDAASAILRPETAVRLKDDKNVTVLSSAGPLQRVIVLNTKRQPFEDRRVRQALALAADRRLALDRLLGGEGRLTGPIPPGHGSWAAASDAQTYRPDPKRAKQLLAQAGHEDGVAATIKVSAGDPIGMPLARLFAEQARDAGIDLAAEELGPTALASAVAARDFDLYLEVVDFLPDPDAYLWPRFHSTGAMNASGYANERFDEVVAQARGSLDPGQRKQLYDDASAILLDDAPAIWWFSENNAEPIRSSVKGYGQSFTGRRTALKRAWLDG